MTQTLAHRELGLTDDELDDITRRLGRDPSLTELAMFSVMWSEHCSYRSSRLHLRQLPTRAPHVLVGPGEGAGVVEVAPGVAVAWKIESHNHPSFVEPVNGAATGVGGIVRDIVSVGARPIALLDSLRFGPLDDARTRFLVDGVVAGISSYGNSIGVATVGGEIVFDPCYAGNPLVNVACLGVVEGPLVRSAAPGPGNAVVLFGSSTGRDGIGGASVLASSAFDGDSGAKRPSVQVGDPFTEKLLIEASLELVGRGLVAGFQDLGAGGLTCPAAEMAAKSGTGLELDLDRVPLREPGMEPFEIAISESQERMVAVVDPHLVGDALEVCRRWGLEAAVVGRVVEGGRVRIRAAGDTVADVPASDLAGGAPASERPSRRPAWIDELARSRVGDEAPRDLSGAWLEVLASPSVASKRWAWEQYDHMIGLGTVVGPGADAAVVRLPDRDVGVALSLDGPGRLCLLDPREGARRAVAEAARNVAATGARPLAVTNCLNLGSPEDPEVMWQLRAVIAGLAEACAALGTPVTGGNVSLNNATDGRPIHPTPVVGMLGVLERAELAVGVAFRRSGDVLVLLGDDGPELAGSEYAWVVHGVCGGRLPPVDLERERALAGLLRRAAARRLLASSHDVSSGGLGACLAESALVGGMGFRVGLGPGAPHVTLFSESPSRALVSCRPDAVAELLALASAAAVPARPIGEVGGRALDTGDAIVSLDEARAAWEDGLRGRLAARVD